MVVKIKPKKKITYGVCGSRKIIPKGLIWKKSEAFRQKEKNFCDEPAKPEDKMKEFSCEK